TFVKILEQKTKKKVSRLTLSPFHFRKIQGAVPSVDIGTGHVLGRDSLGQSKDLDRRCDVLGHLGHIYNIYIYTLFGKLIIKLKSNYTIIILLSNGPILMNIFLFCSSY